MIISGGLNIWPVDIESTIAEIDGIEEVAVIGPVDVRFGETPMAIIRSSRAIESAKIIADRNARMPTTRCRATSFSRTSHSPA